MSITSMSNRARMAEKLSIEQLQQSIQDGVLPSYIGVPLLKSKVEDAKLLQAAKAAQSMSQQPSVAQQIMSQAQQVEQPAPQMADQGVPALQSNLPASMAGGGIVAFAGGGMYDEEDYDEDREDAQRQAEMDGLMEEYAQTFQQGIGQLPAAQPQSREAPAQSQGSEGIAGGDTSEFIARIMQKESRGQRYGRDGQLLTSPKGAQGEMQVMPGTSRDPGYGVKAARDGGPDELARVGRDYATALLERYGDPKLAAIAYNMGPGATDKWLAAGADMSKLPKETQGYVKGFAGGGEVRFQNRGLVENERESEMMRALKTPFRALYGNKSEVPSDEDYTTSGDLGGAIMAQSKPSAAKSSKPKVEAKPTVATQKGPTAYDLASEADDRSFGVVDRTAPQQVAPIADDTPEKQLSKLEQYQEALSSSIGKREENLGKQREQDKYMAMLQAGLGMMGGTSRNALANIGAGGQQGIQSLMASNKDRTAEENALLSGKLGLLKLGTSAEQASEMRKMRGELQRDVLAQRDAQAKAGLAGRAEDRTLREQNLLRDDVAGIRAKAEKYAEEAIKTDPAFLGKTPEERIAAHQAYVDSYLKRDDTFAALYKKLNNKDYFSGGAGTMSGGYGAPPKGAVKPI